MFVVKFIHIHINGQVMYLSSGLRLWFRGLENWNKQTFSIMIATLHNFYSAVHVFLTSDWCEEALSGLWRNKTDRRERETSLRKQSKHGENSSLSFIEAVHQW